ncbi:SDR family NAD(P)-dependent oxidoreductase [Lacibacterium aquatile]|uniref:SDR family NAD(P)-dependent oxidoreductase n=1 Tax=Lacibacterium aquatile TaxID=1168082 RepID=A0ABW5DQT0_9PROT
MNGPNVWITGAGSGIGLAVAERIATSTSRVIVSGRRLEPLAELAARHANVRALSLDVTDRDAVRQAVAEIGLIDIAILCAGTHRPTPASNFDAQSVRNLIDTNLMGIVNCVEALLPPMLERGTGQLVLVGSVAGYRGLPTAAGYCASKAAVIALAEALRLDLADTGVDVRLVSPGFVDTPLTQENSFPMPDLITAEKAAQHILKGLAKSGFEIAFPARFAFAMRCLRLLPDRLYFPLMRKVTGC